MGPILREALRLHRESQATEQDWMTALSLAVEQRDKAQAEVQTLHFHLEDLLDVICREGNRSHGDAALRFERIENQLRDILDSSRLQHPRHIHSLTADCGEPCPGAALSSEDSTQLKALADNPPTTPRQRTHSQPAYDTYDLP